MEAEKAAKLVQRLKRECDLFSNITQNIGEKNGKDSPMLRNKVEKARRDIGKTDGGLQDMFKNAPPGDKAWDQLKTQYKDIKRNYDNTDTQAKKREKENPIGGGDDAGTSGGGGGARGGGGADFRMTDLKRVDMSELNTEESLQNEKLQGVREIEQDMSELKSVYTEFNENVVTQGKGLDKMEDNVQKSTINVEKGIVDLKASNKMQKSSRKKMCILLVILSVTITAVVIIIVVLKK